ncbi:MAG TPA: methyltransferase domain-containing protein [Vicinamibacterales bacterium]|nr:methyltransferase domain-containing protein [Vicinamibacterales bacterium]
MSSDKRTETSDLKQCCARLYESEIVSRLLGDSFHPGGPALTERLGQLLDITPGSHVLDVASGKGTSAVVIAQQFGCTVVGVDLSAPNVAEAAAEADRLGLGSRVRFEVGDAEQLPFDDESVDAIICECAFCTFPDKPQAAREFVRVLKGGGRVGLSDITREPGPEDELRELMAWITCLADARPAGTYGEWLTAAGFHNVMIERHDDALTEMVRAIGTRLFLADVIAGLKKIDLAGIDIVAANRLARQALRAVEEHRLGYAIVAATKAADPRGGRGLRPLS